MTRVMREGAARGDGLLEALHEHQRRQKAGKQPGLERGHFMLVFVWV